MDFLISITSSKRQSYTKVWSTSSSSSSESSTFEIPLILTLAFIPKWLQMNKNIDKNENENENENENKKKLILQSLWFVKKNNWNDIDYYVQHKIKEREWERNSDSSEHLISEMWRKNDRSPHIYHS